MANIEINQIQLLGREHGKIKGTLVAYSNELTVSSTIVNT